MVRNWILRLLLLPLALIYGLGSLIYNQLFDWGILARIRFSLPVIGVGNLSVGGTGKTPHTEYLINLLKPYLQVAVLSRGYKRNSRGFLKVQPSHTVREVGDEPLLYKSKYNTIGVFVDENRVEGISQMLMKNPEIQTVLLDDVFQHRSIIPGLNILLTEFDYPFFNDFFLPYGKLREWRTGYKRADTIIVTKCPTKISKNEMNNIIHKINPLPHQTVFFSRYKYYNPYFIYNFNSILKLDESYRVVLISALASSSYLLNYLQGLNVDVTSLEYTDHHDFTHDEIEKLKIIYDNLTSQKKIILTTEKDAMRLDVHREYIIQNKLPIYILPVSVEFIQDDQLSFDEYVKNFLLDFKV